MIWNALPCCIMEIFGNAINESAKSRQEAFNSFWDYFLLDYRLMLRDMHPLEYFYETVCSSDSRYYDAGFAKRNSDILKEIISARLVLFTVEGFGEEGMYLCRDFLTNETYQLNLPLTEDIDTTDMLFIGHLFYNDNMLTENMRGYKIDNINALCLRDTLKRAYKWVSVQQQEPNWQWFSEYYPMVLRNMLFLYAAGIAHKNFNNYTEHTAFAAAPYSDETLVAGILKKYYAEKLFCACRCAAGNADVVRFAGCWCRFGCLQ